MKKRIAISFVMILVAGCGRDERPMSASCKPSVSVVIMRSKGSATPVRTPRNVVQVYWDVSRSMRDFKELPAVVGGLDSRVLLSAGAERVEQYGVGERIALLPNARAALQRTAKRTVLHLAAEQFGTALASGSAQAAIVVSDMELDTPPLISAANATVCRGVPLPSAHEAGTLFGRCFESAVATGTAARTNLLVHVFRKKSGSRELFILLLATDRVFGLRISGELSTRLQFSRDVIFDSGAVTGANVRGCRLTAPADVAHFPKPGCRVKCFEREGAIEGECDLQRHSSDAWIVPAAHGLSGASYRSLAKKPGDTEERAVVRFRIPCSAPPGKHDASVSFSWQRRDHGHTAFGQTQNVRDLFDSLADAIVRTAAPRQLRIGIAMT